MLLFVKIKSSISFQNLSRSICRGKIQIYFREGERGCVVLAIGRTMESCIHIRSLLLHPKQNLPANMERIHTSSC